VADQSTHPLGNWLATSRRSSNNPSLDV